MVGILGSGNKLLQHFSSSLKSRQEEREDIGRDESYGSQRFTFVI